jgi:hypothetical protein
MVLGLFARAMESSFVVRGRRVDRGAVQNADEGNSENGSDSTRSPFLGPPAANRHRLPDERPAITHHFAVGGHEGYLTVGLYPNGQPGEIFIRMAREGSTIGGLIECFGAVVSVSLQHGVRCGYFATSCRIRVSSHQAGRGTRNWAMRSRTWTTSSGGWSSASCPEPSSECFPHSAITAMRQLSQLELFRFRRWNRKLATLRPALPAAL